MSQNPKILYISPNRDFSGYATAARNYIRALDKVGCNLVTRSLHYDGGRHELSSRELELQSRDLQNVDIILAHTTPNELEYKPGLFNVNYFAWETDRVPGEWVQQINKMDLALVPCDANLSAARRSGVKIPIEKIEHTFDSSTYDVDVTPFLIPGGENHFKFLSICQISKKKGLDALLKAYFSEFTAADNVLLILKVYFGSKDTEEHKQRMVNQINKMKELLRMENYPQVYVVHGVMDENAIAKLYETSDCYVLPSRGEGWGIPHFDAMGYGKPPIAVNWGGPTEFITPETGWLVDCHMSPCFDMMHPHPFMYTGKDNWAEPHIDSLRSAMREAHQEWKFDRVSSENSRWQQRIASCESRVDDFSHEIIGNKMKNAILGHYDKWKESNAGH
jgi:glycosyltransferase involved in cell wall biosynthesis